MSAQRGSFIRGTATALAFLLALATGAHAAYVEHTLTFRQQDLALAKSGAYDIILLPGCDIMREIGRPQLPVLSLTLAVPQGASAVRLEIVDAESRELVERFTPLPAQPPQILPTPALEPRLRAFVDADRSVYGQSQPYPSSVAEITSGGHLPGNEAVGISVYPLQYIPDAGRMRFFSRITVRLHYEPAPAWQRRPAPEAEPLRQAVRALVANDSQVYDYSPRKRAGDSLLEAGDYEYVVVTSSALVSSFAPLVEWKTRRGIPATTVTVDWIDDSYQGIDTQERIRAFIGDAQESWGTIFCLLGGDTQIVPARRAYAMTCEAGGHPDEDAIGCDLYYADLDGTWDGDGDGTYGEVTDGVDLYPDVFVGRAPVTGEVDAENFVSKVISYERAPPPGHCLSMLMAGEVLWTDPFTDSGIGLNMIDRESVPPRFDPITKLYQALGNESVTSVVSALNSGEAHFLHDGHAWYTLMGCGNGYLGISQVDNLANGQRLPVVYSIGCWPAAFDLENSSCIAEHFITAPRGGAVAFIGNSRYGWGAPGNPGYGHSDRFMQKFYSVILGEGPSSAGAALAVSKASFIPFSQTENVYRWHQYQVNLLGDPEMHIWTDEPTQLAVTHPDSLVAGSSVFDVAVWDARGPVEGALVCLMNHVDVYQRARTAEDGTASLLIESAVSESIGLTVTAPDRLPYETRIAVDATGAHLRVQELVVDDSAEGNDDGLAGPGETVDIELTLRNAGTDDAGAVAVTLSSDDPHVEFIVSAADYGHIAAGTAVGASSAFRLRTSDGCADGHAIPLDVTITADGVRRTWTAGAVLTVAAPVLVARSYSVDDAGAGDGDGVPEPGERLRIMVELENTGLAPALAPEVILLSHDPLIAVTSASANLSDVGSNDVGSAVFAIEIDPLCPTPYFPTLEIETHTRDGQTCLDAILITVGSAGLADDLESGAHGWTHGGDNDLWTLTDLRTHSGQASWYCGSPALHEYTDDMDAHLDSPSFVLGAGAELSFWCWYEVPIYHEDGMYVELLSRGTAVDTLDFMGSGGALGHLGTIGNEWLEYRHHINHAAGDTFQLRFRFVTDEADVAEGVYIDDIVITTSAAPSGYSIPGNGTVELPISLHQNRPNPFTPYTNIGFTMATDGPVTLSVYNIQGRLIRTLIDESRWAGEHSAFWDGKDEVGVDVAAGVYMYRLSFGEHEATRKMILVR